MSLWGRWRRHTRETCAQLERAIRTDMEADARLERARRQGDEAKALAVRARDARLRNHYGEAIAFSFATRGKRKRWHF